MNIKAEHEDMIFPVREFITRLRRIMTREIAELYDQLINDGFPQDQEMMDKLIKYVAHSDHTTNSLTFEEFCEEDFSVKD